MKIKLLERLEVLGEHLIKGVVNLFQEKIPLVIDFSMKIYGIKTCSIFRKALKFIKDKNIEFDFIDYKTEKVDENKIREWLKQVDLKILFNNRGKKYRDLKLKELNLDDEGKIEWLAKENYLIKRPVIEYNGQVIVGFDEERYKEIF